MTRAPAFNICTNGSVKPSKFSVSNIEIKCKFTKERKLKNKGKGLPNYHSCLPPNELNSRSSENLNAFTILEFVLQ